MNAVDLSQRSFIMTWWFPPCMYEISKSAFCSHSSLCVSLPRSTCFTCRLWIRGPRRPTWSTGSTLTAPLAVTGTTDTLCKVDKGRCFNHWPHMRRVLLRLHLHNNRSTKSKITRSNICRFPIRSEPVFVFLGDSTSSTLRSLRFIFFLFVLWTNSFCGFSLLLCYFASLPVFCVIFIATQQETSETQSHAHIL